jgi:lipopolysaccharide cholinephosphotransferase
MNNQTVRDVQDKILEVMKFIDKLCRDNGIVYYIMGGTALGAIRHGGFIPWDDDLDIFMTPTEYDKFVKAFITLKQETFMIQEWKTTPAYLEYTKVRMNGTTLIEHNFAHRKDMHHGIYVDIMILHKVPENYFVQKLVYYESKFVTLYGLSQRGWQPKTKGQALVLKSLKLLPCKWIAKKCYERIYKYEHMIKDFVWCYWITPASFYKGLFEPKFFESPMDVPFEDTKLIGSAYIKDYLAARYGDYMKLPSIEQQEAAVHAKIFDTEKDYKEYINQY